MGKFVNINSALVAAQISNAGQADAIVGCGYDGGAKNLLLVLLLRLDQDWIDIKTTSVGKV